MKKKSLLKAVTSVTAFFVFVISLSITAFSVSAESSKASLEQRIQHLEELNRTRNKVQADISYQLTELQREVRSLTGQVEENSFKLKQIQDRQRELYRDIEGRLSGMAGQTTSQAKTPRNTVKQLSNNTGATENNTARREFEAAFALVRNKNYNDALTAFNEFLEKYPNSSYSANAHYWMGQVYLVKSNSAKAEQQFVSLILNFPESTKTAPAKLKLGDIYLKQKKWLEAKTHYTDVANNSSGANQQLARKGLGKIKQAGH